MDVNLYGPFRVTKAFAPLILASKGRITTIGSISGILAPRDLDRLRDEQTRHGSIHGFAGRADGAARRAW